MLKIEPSGLIYLRSTEDWESIARHTPPHNLAYLNERKRKCLIKNIQLWDQYCDISYCEYRSFLKKLAKSTWEKTGMDVVVKIPKGFKKTIIFPTDDDDWMAPNILECVQHQSDNKNMIYWDNWMWFMSKNLVSYGGHVLVPMPKEFRWAGSNGYAVQGRVDERAVLEHTQSKKLYTKEETKYIKKILSVWVHHPASTFSLSNKIFLPKDLFNNMFTLPDIPRELSWAKPLFHELYHFTKSVFTDIKMV